MKRAGQYADVVREAIDSARGEGFHHVAGVLQRVLDSSAPKLSDLDIDQLRTFARFVSDRGALLHPYWDHAREPYVEADEDEFLGLMNGFYGLFASFLLDELGIPVRPDVEGDVSRGPSN
jgi:hypothetical protein